MKRVIILLPCVLLLGYLMLRAWACMVYNYDRDIGNQDRIAKAYISFYRDKNEFAASLKQLASTGYLPTRGAFYREPPGFWNRECDVSVSSYEIFPATEDALTKLRILARKTQDGNWDFNPPINSDIHDGIMGVKASREGSKSQQTAK